MDVPIENCKNAVTKGVALVAPAFGKLPGFQIPRFSIPKRVQKKKAATGTEKEVKKSPSLTDVIAGATARAGSQSAIHPIDTIKVRMQAPAPGTGASKIFLGSTAPQQFASLYKGVGGAASGAGVAIGAYFAFYGAATEFFKNHTDLSVGAIAFCAGAFGAAGSSLIKVPAAVCIRSVQASVYPNVIVAAKSIVKSAGPRGLYTGFLPTLLEDIPDMAIKFASYEVLRATHSKITGKGRGEAAVHEDLIMGGFSGALAAAGTTPLDVVKTRMMTTAATRPTLVGSAVEVYKAGGAKNFFTGVKPRALSNGLNSAVFFCFFEAIRAQLNAMEEKKARNHATEVQYAAPATDKSFTNANGTYSDDRGAYAEPQPASISVAISKKN